MFMEYNQLSIPIRHLLSKTISLRVVYYHLMKLVGPDYAESIKIISEKKPFLITSTGRTGTTLFAKMLNSVPGNYVVHEPVPEEQYYHMKALTNHNLALLYIKNFRLSEMAYRINKTDCTRYGEVNGALRRHIVALKEAAPFFKFIHIIRNGRKVVTSVLNRGTLTSTDRIYSQMVPPKEDIHPEEWNKMNRFQKICWIWAYENEYMRKYCDSSVRFEDLISTYDYFRQNILIPLGLTIDYEIWKKFVLMPINTNRQVVKKNSYNGWTDEQKAYFWKVCGSEMKLFGYK